MAYSRDGQGLHRAVDPADGEAYLYGHAFLAAAPRMFGCFDQPDLKAPFTVTVATPPHWTVVGNGAATHTESGRWELAVTPPLATYFVTVCAGPYVTRRTEHDGIPLAIHARRSLEGPLDRWAEEVFTLTRQGLDRYHGLFGLQVCVRRVPPGVRPGVQRRRDGEPRLRDDPRRPAVPGDHHGRRAADPGPHDRARARPHVVRRPRDHAVVGRPVAQRVLRRVHGDNHPGPRHEVPRGVDLVRDRPQDVGVCGRAAAEHPPGRGVPGARRRVGVAGLRRDLLRQGRVGDPAARRLPRRGGVDRRRRRLPARARLRERDLCRPRPGARAGQRPGPGSVVRRVAAHRRPRPPSRRDGRRGRRGRIGAAPPTGAGRPSRRPDPRARRRRVERRGRAGAQPG